MVHANPKNCQNAIQMPIKKQCVVYNILAEDKLVCNWETRPSAEKSEVLRHFLKKRMHAFNYWPNSHQIHMKGGDSRRSFLENTGKFITDRSGILVDTQSTAE
jgi:hypothetical protein